MLIGHSFLLSRVFLRKLTLPAIHKGLTISSCEALPDRIYPRYETLSNLKLKRLVWPSTTQLRSLTLRNVFLMKKPHNDQVTLAMNRFIQHLTKNYPQVNIIVTEQVAEEMLAAEKVKKESPKGLPISVYTGSFSEIVTKSDLLVTLGGDGTILKSASLFADNYVPPVLSFSLGTLGFLLPYDFSNFKAAFAKVYLSESKALQRSRLECYVVKNSPHPEIKSENIAFKPIENGKKVARVHAMNDVTLHRGATPHLATLDVYVDGEFLTRATGDGLVVSSPTGSTAYLLSAGGSIVHPLVKCILLTPICPRSLSFRPLIVPSTLHIKIKVRKRNLKLEHESSINCREDPLDVILPNQLTSAKLSVDGASHSVQLNIGDELHIVNEIGTIFIPGSSLPQLIHEVSSNSERAKIMRKIHSGGGIVSGSFIENEHKGVYCIAKSENDWTKGINELLGFNSRFKEKTERLISEEEEC